MKFIGAMQNKEIKTISRPRRMPSLVICTIMWLVQYFKNKSSSSSFDTYPSSEI